MKSIATEFGFIEPLTESEIVEVAGGPLPVALYLVAGVAHGALIYYTAEYLTDD
ncbi:MAG: hypothetical protein H2049_13280 [Porphyrobacter sp.]|nr:hypothetical protein [Porphyrobacter sp.]